MGCYCDYEMPSMFDDHMHKARKHHRCDECMGEIAPGQSYKKIVGVWEGRFNSYKHCSKCLSLIELMDSHIKCWCWYYGGVIYSAVEEIRNIGSDASAMVFPVYRHAVRRKRNVRALKADAAINMTANGEGGE